MSSAPRPELDKRFDPQSFEMSWYRLQEESGQFRPEVASDDARPYTLVIPPPNVTGRLHVGHALGRTLEDVLCALEADAGRAVLWVPGVDHAGIATQMVVERELDGTDGKTPPRRGARAVRRGSAASGSRREAGRHPRTRSGGSAAPATGSREYYTLDAPRSQAVRDAFSELYHRGSPTATAAMVNWCPRCATVLSDLEVNHVESSGQLWSVAYPLEDGSGDARRRHDAPRDDARRHGGRGPPGGRALPAPRREEGRGFRSTDRLIPVIADEMVDRKFGTGVVKVTPGARPERLRGGPAARPRRDRRHRLRREDDRRGRPGVRRLDRRGPQEGPRGPRASWASGATTSRTRPPSGAASAATPSSSRSSRSSGS